MGSLSYTALPPSLPSSLASPEAPTAPTPPRRPPPPADFVQMLRDEQASGSRPEEKSSPLGAYASVHMQMGAAVEKTSPMGADVSFHAGVGAEVDRTALEGVLGRLMIEARCKFHQGKFEEALALFQQSLAVTETAGGGHAEYGAIQHNLASCLHCLGDFEGARGHYEAALAAFDRSAPSRFWVAIYGDVDQRRREFVRERLVDVELRRKPDLDKYLDGYGTKREVTPDLSQPPRPPTKPNLATIASAGLGVAYVPTYGQ